MLLSQKAKDRKNILLNQKLLEIAQRQSAAEMNCTPEVFAQSKNIVTEAAACGGIRSYYTPPVLCNLVSYGNNIVATAGLEYHAILQEYINRYPFYYCFETPAIHWLDAQLRQYQACSCYMAEYWLPDCRRLELLPCAYPVRQLVQTDFAELYCPEWHNALCETRKELDILGFGAYDGAKLVGLAACSADCDTMWQIGVDVLPQYRRKGIASSLTARLAAEILKKGKVPFYCCAWANIPSARNAMKSGFYPAWTELAVKPEQLVAEIL